MNKRIIFPGITGLLTSVLILCCIGCKGADGPQGPAGPSLTGDIIGYAYLVDVNGTRASDNSGIAVSVEGKSTSATTSADGRWVLSGLSSGTYTINMQKTGFGLRKVVGLQFVGGGQEWWGTTSLYQIPSFTVTGLAATISSGMVNISGNLTGSFPANYRYLRLFLSTSNTVSSSPSNYSYAPGVSVYNSTSFLVDVSPSSLSYYGITSGSTVYIVAYADSWGTMSYIDLITGRSFYTTLNPTPSNVVSVVVP